MYCSNCGINLTEHNYSCARKKECNDQNPICYNCAKRYVSSPIRWCSICKKLGTCEMCSDYDYDEIKRRKNLSKEKLDWRVLQMCPLCFNNYIS